MYPPRSKLVEEARRQGILFAQRGDDRCVYPRKPIRAGISADPTLRRSRSPYNVGACLVKHAVIHAADCRPVERFRADRAQGIGDQEEVGRLQTSYASQ